MLVATVARRYDAFVRWPLRPPTISNQLRRTSWRRRDREKHAGEFPETQRGPNANPGERMVGSKETEMANLWERVRTLEGQTLLTVTGRGAFDVVERGVGYVRIVPRASGKSRRIERREFEQAETLGLTTVDVTPIQLREAGVAEYNSTYVAAMIRATEEHSLM